MEIRSINNSMQSQMRSISPQAEAPRRAISEGDSSAQDRMLRTEANRVDRLEVGFGNNSVNTTSAALQAIDINFELSRRVVPSPEELREASLERRAEQQANEEALREQTAAIVGLTNTDQPTPRSNSTPVSPPEAFRPVPAPAVNNYNNSAAIMNSPTTEITTPAPEPATPNTINQPDDMAGTPASQTASTLPGNRLNLLA